MPGTPRDPSPSFRPKPIKSPTDAEARAEEEPPESASATPQKAQPGDVEDGDEIVGANPPQHGGQVRMEDGEIEEGGGIRYSIIDEPGRGINVGDTRERTASTLAIWLLAILAGTIVLHYLMLTILLCSVGAKELQESYKPIDQVFNTILPVLSGLVGSAITYYFTKEARASSATP